MTEQVFRQPLSVLPIVRPNQNLNTNINIESPSKSGKRTYDAAALDAKAPPVGTVTPTKASATAINGRRSVKRVKPDVSLREEPELSTAQLKIKAEEEHAVKLKTWIASYKKQFPSLKFFFDACPEDDVRRCSRKILALGGSVEPFFSNNVNVVVSTREQPKAQRLVSQSFPDPAGLPQSLAAYNMTQGALRNMQHVPPTFHRASDNSARPDTHIHDVLVKAQLLGIKVWTLRKLRDSVLKNLIADHTQAINQRTLSNTLRSEKFLGAGVENIVQFKGPYILVRDMNEQYRPIMCREWPNVQNPKDGEWPQWRTTRPGRCPFIRDKQAEQTRDVHVTKVRPERPLLRGPFQHPNASGIQQITSAIQSNLGRSAWSGKENLNSSVVANLHKKAIAAKRPSKLQNNNLDPTDAKKVKVDVKAGYCENCREKFDDFDAHLRTRQHRSYAKNESNFYDLDVLLGDLLRAPREEHALHI